jgi:uncharacterized lipoprotein YddW (UPF0748 family)
MMWQLVVSMVVGSVSQTSESLDEFTYRTVTDARRAWQTQADRGVAQPVEVVQQEGRWVLELPAPFAARQQLERVYMDREVTLDLAAAGEFALELRPTVDDATARISLYFRSGDGWYAGGQELSATTWHTLRFSKAGFVTEGQPAGWHCVDRIRIAVWRQSATDFRVQLRGLRALQHAVALVIPADQGQRERETARQAADEVGELLAELGLGSDAVDDSALIHGALGHRSVAILAYNPDMSAETVEALVQYVQRGGKVLACYQLPADLATALGFAELTYVRPARTGEFAEMRFQAEDIPGLPAAARQASWNITRAQPVAYNARVVAHWYDDRGQATGQPAVLVSDRGAFVTHIILRDDREQKKQMLAALLGHLASPLWQQMADHAVAASGRVGHLDSAAAVAEFLAASDSPDVLSHLREAQQLQAAAAEQQGAGQYADVVRLAGLAHEQLVQAYVRAQPSLPVEGRACWNHSGTGAYDGDWDRTARELAENGFNIVLPNMLWGGLAHYPSDVLPRSRTFEKHGDQIAQCVAAAHKYGLQVHVWKVNWNLSTAPQDFVARIRAERRNQVSVRGETEDWLCPSHPDNFQLELDSMLEVARRYEVDGLHFDYIRYPDRDKCYCDGCRARFEQATGRTVTQWPADCYSGALKDEYNQWRCDQITRLVQAVHSAARQVRPGIAISAAVFGDYPGCRASVAQDWVAWIQAGYLDFVCPMDYTQSDQHFVGLVTSQVRLVEGRIPIYAGIGQWRLPVDRTVGQIYHARQAGAAGFTMFDLTRESIESAVPAIGRGVGRARAEPPHHR